MKHKILAIDDAPLVLRALNEVLKGHFDVIIAKSGEAGIESAKKNKPDLILLDLVMPGLSGFETLVLLKGGSETREIPVIFVTGSEVESDEQRGYKEGAVGFIKKPFVGTEVIDKIKSVLEV